MSDARPRNVQLEREITRHACKGAIDPSDLIRHAEARARSLSGEYVPDPMLVQTGRHRDRDVREELVDARNHLVWLIEDHPGDPRIEDWMIALRFIALAYERLTP